MLAYGLYGEHLLALLSGRVGLVTGIVAIVKAARGARRWALFGAAAIGCSAVALGCGAYVCDGFRLALESPDFLLCFVPGFVGGTLGLLVVACRPIRLPA